MGQAMKCNRQRKNVGVTGRFPGRTLRFTLRFLFSLWVPLFISSPVDAWWFGSCCEKEDWYSLDAGTLSWICFSDELGIYTLREYIKQKDYEAAKSVARELMGKSKCFFAANTELDLYVYTHGTQKVIRRARPRGYDYHVYVFHEALMNKGTKRELKSEEQQFVSWAIQETQKVHEQKQSPQGSSPDASAKSRRSLDRGTLDISLGMSIQEVRKIFRMQERQDPVVAFLKKVGVDASDKEAANKVLNKRSFLLTVKGTSFPDGVTSVDVQFVRNSLYQIGVHYAPEYINKIGWLEFVATFVEKFGTPTGSSSSHREWSDENTQISIAHSGNVVNVHYTDLVAQRLIEEEEFRMKGKSPVKKK